MSTSIPTTDMTKITPTAERLTTSDAMSTSNPTTDMATTIRLDSRLLALPPELRNRIYKTLADDIFSVPLMASYKTTSERSNSFNQKSLESACERHDERRGPQHTKRFALLSTCRQVYLEASKILFSSMQLDLRYVSSRPMRLLNAVFMSHLRHVRHIELHISLAEAFLPTPSNHLALRQLLEECFGSDMHAGKQALRLRTLLFGLRTVTIYSVDDEDEYHHLGFRVLIHLASQALRQTVQRLFPFLEDIITVNSWGGERFGKKKGGGWELWYSKEVIPLFEPYTSFHSFDGTADEDTDLSVASTLGKLCAAKGSVRVL